MTDPRSELERQETCEHEFEPHSTTYPHIQVCRLCRKAECACCGSDMGDIYDTRPRGETQQP